jgi:hypothetical protein
MGKEQTRKELIAKVQKKLERLHSPRLQMTLIVALTGAIGFLASYTLLQLGFESLWMRYASSVVIAYVAFLTLLWVWLKWPSDQPDALLDLADPSLMPTSSNSTGGSSAEGLEIGDASELANLGDLEGLGVILIILGILLAATLAAGWIIWGAPALLAELMLDATLATGLYQRIRTIEGKHWLQSAIKRTWVPFAAVTLCFAVGGAAMQAYAPEADSIQEVINHKE